MPESKAFLGRGWGFPPEFTRRGKRVRMASAEDDVRESLRILLSTAPGERVMHPTYGCGLNDMVFEVLNEATLAEIGDVVERAVLFFEPRITLDDIDVAVTDELAGKVEIRLDYTIRSTNSRSNMVYPFYLLEGTNIGTPA